MAINEQILRKSIRRQLLRERAERGHIKESKEKKDTEISRLCDKESVGYIQEYGKSGEISRKLEEIGFVDSVDGGTLYNDGRLIFWLNFKDTAKVQKFFLYFFEYEDKVEFGHEENDGKWHLMFDSQDDPGARVEEGVCLFLLQYFAETGKLSEVDGAIEDILFKINGIDTTVWDDSISAK